MITTLTTLSAIDSIGNSLSSLNADFGIMDNFTYYLSLSTYQLFKPLVDFYTSNKSSLESMVTTVQTNSAKWEAMKNLVTTNSAKWITPIIYISPAIEMYPVSIESVSAIIDNFKNIYPILSGSNMPYNVENQKAIIYYYVSDTKDTVADSYTTNSASINCQSEGYKYAYINCTNHVGSGSTRCNGDDVGCGGCGSSCQKSVGVSCNFPETGTSQTSRFISATINSNFSDRYERDIKAIVFTVKNCMWTFERNLI